MRLNYSPEELEAVANTLRKDIVHSIYCAGSGHPGGSLSIAEIMSVLYFHEMNVDPERPDWSERDRFVLSKGHAAPCYYAVLCERGYFERSKLASLRESGSLLQGHPDMKKTPGVDMSTGSLGQGISAACGQALYAKKNSLSYRVFCVLGDGEMQEGQVWEAFMSASHFKLDNLTVILDNNNLQIDGSVDKVMSIYPVAEKLTAFGWDVIEADGNDIKSLLSAFETVRGSDKATFFLCHTVKGKGVSFMENQAAWHGQAIDKDSYERAMSELCQRRCL